MSWGQVYTSAVNSQQVAETELSSLLVIKSSSVTSLSTLIVLSTIQFCLSSDEENVLKPQDLNEAKKSLF